MARSRPPTRPRAVRRGLGPHRRHRRVGDPRRRRQGQGAQGRRAGRSSASAPASPTSRPRTRSSRRPSRPAATRATTATPRPAGCPSSRRRSWPRPRATPGYDVTPGQVLVTNGGKQAVYEAFATLLDPGDEVLLPAPYWTTYPESIRLAGGVPVEVLADETQGYLVTVDAARGGPHRPHEGAAVLLAVQPDRRGLPAASRSRRSAGGRSSTACGSSPTRSTSTWSTTAPQAVSMPVAVPELADRCVVRQRRGQDVRDDRLAGRLADRARPTWSRRRPTCSRTRRPTSPTCRSGRRSRR